MTRPSLALLLVVVLAVPASGAGPADEKAVMATLEAMATATIDKDKATLARIYGDDVTYSHSAGITETKAQVLAGIRGTRVDGTYMRFSDTAIRFFGDVALAKGVVDFRSAASGRMTDNHLNILWVLARRAEGPHGWQIVARQTTRIGPSVGTPVPDVRAAETRRFDQVHLAAADPAKAVEWYITMLGAEPWPDDEPFRAKSGDTRIIFLRSATAKSSLGGVADHIGWSVPDVDAKMRQLAAAGVKIVSPVTQLPGLYKAGVIEDPWGTRIQIVQDPDTPGLHHVQLLVADPDATYAWFLSYFGGERRRLKGTQDALKYGAVWLLASRGEGEESRGRAIDHIGFGTTSRPGSLAELGAKLKAGGVTFKQEQHGIRVGSKPVQVFIIQGPSGCEIEVLER